MIFWSLLSWSKIKNDYDKYFEDKISNIKNAWKGIKHNIYLQKLTNESPKIISLRDQTIPDTPMHTMYHLNKTRFPSHFVQKKYSK